MAERIARLFGPGVVSPSMSSPTTLFTVPTASKYVLRFLTVTQYPSTGATPTQSVVLGKTNLLPTSLIGGLDLTSLSTGVTSDTQALATPFDEGEVLVGALGTSLTTPSFLSYDDANDATWGDLTTVDATVLQASSAPQNIDVPTNVYFVAVSTKASAPDTISSITDSHTNPVKNIASIVTVASSTVRASIWGGYAPVQPTTNTVYTVNFGGTFTSAFADAFAISDAALVPATPSTSNIILQTATATGTTETVQSVTMTPTAAYGGGTFQILVLGTDGRNGSYTGGTGFTTEIADGGLSTPNSTAAAYLFAPAVTNPFATLSAAGTGWAAACIEIPYGGIPGITLSGVIIE